MVGQWTVIFHIYEMKVKTLHIRVGGQSEVTRVGTSSVLACL